ncbi:MAG: hypothetical protein KIT10_10500 [Flavobacteriales bacterium]|nr:hypothetical protein [Flavobacteriales bacterium]
MIATTFRSNRPAVLLLAPPLCLLLFGGMPFRTYHPYGEAMPLYALLQSVAGLTPWLPGIVGVLLIMAITVQLARLANDTEQLDRRNHLPAMLFPLFLATFGQGLVLDPALAGMPLVLWAMRRTWAVGKAGHALRQVFDAGLLLGAASLFYLPYAFLLVVVWSSVAVIRPFQWREYLLPVIGVGVVFFFAWAWLHVSGMGPWRPLTTIPEWGRPVVPAPAGQRVLAYLVAGGLALVSIINYSSSYQRAVVRLKNLRASFMGLVAALGVVVLALRLLNGAFPPVLFAAPMAVFLAHPFLGERRAWLQETTCLALLILALWAQWGA